ncbi:MAG: N-acetylmuramoyl-L-alanine amidase [Candidatus Omnitrophota bacterium]
MKKTKKTAILDSAVALNLRAAALAVVPAFLLLFLTSCTVTHVPSLPPERVIKSVYEPAPIPVEVREGIYHSLAPGETLWRISKMYDVDEEVIRKVNKIKNVRDLDIGEKLYIPGACPRKNIVTLYPNDKWEYIIIHHSATDKGNSMQFDRVHLQKGWKGVGYHFIIDNGTLGKDDGQIETSPRWIKQTDGAHCKAGKMNEKGIGICLVGNFSEERVSEKQMGSLAYLVKELKRFYKIPAKNIMGHGQVSGAKTECPGKKFPWEQLKKTMK